MLEAWQDHFCSGWPADNSELCRIADKCTLCRIMVRANLCGCYPAIFEHIRCEVADQRFPLVSWPPKPGNSLAVAHHEQLATVLRRILQAVAGGHCNRKEPELVDGVTAIP